jgi:hypothetical protein
MCSRARWDSWMFIVVSEGMMTLMSASEAIAPPLLPV